MTGGLRLVVVSAVGVLILAGAVVATQGSPPAAPAAPPAAAAPATKPLVVLSGTDSDVRRPAFHRVESDEQWAAIWKSHHGSADWDHPRPAVDFARCLVVAAFRGATENTEPMAVDSVIEGGDAVVVRFTFQGYATGVNVEPHAVTPFGFVVLPRTDKPIVLEEDAVGHKQDPTPVWKEVARLAPAGK